LEVQRTEQASKEVGRAEVQQASNDFNKRQTKQDTHWAEVLVKHARSVSAHRASLMDNEDVNNRAIMENSIIREQRNDASDVTGAQALLTKCQQAKARNEAALAETERLAAIDTIQKIQQEKIQFAAVAQKEALLNREAVVVEEVLALEDKYQTSIANAELDAELAIEASERELKAEEDEAKMLDQAVDQGDAAALELQDKYLLDQRLDASMASIAPSTHEHKLHGKRVSPHNGAVAPSQSAFMMG